MNTRAVLVFMRACRQGLDCLHAAPCSVSNALHNVCLSLRMCYHMGPAQALDAIHHRRAPFEFRKCWKRLGWPAGAGRGLHGSSPEEAARAAALEVFRRHRREASSFFFFFFFFRFCRCFLLGGRLQGSGAGFAGRCLRVRNLATAFVLVASQTR